MCIIIAKKKGVKAIPLQHIYESGENNGDNISVYASNGVDTMVHKYTNHWDLIRDIHLYNNEDWTVVIHARIATHGAVDFINCHPFPLSDNYDDVINRQQWKGKRFCHNGIMSKYGLDQTFSDSIHFGVNFLSKKQKRKDVEKEIGSFNKIVMMDKDILTIYNTEEGHYKEGIRYSNHTYLPRVYTYNTMYGGGMYGNNEFLPAKGNTKVDYEGEDYEKEEEIIEYVSQNYPDPYQYTIDMVEADIRTSSGINCKNVDVRGILEFYIFNDDLDDSIMFEGDGEIEVDPEYDDDDNEIEHRIGKGINEKYIL